MLALQALLNREMRAELLVGEVSLAASTCARCLTTLQRESVNWDRKPQLGGRCSQGTAEVQNAQLPVVRGCHRSRAARSGYWYSVSVNVTESRSNAASPSRARISAAGVRSRICRSPRHPAIPAMPRPTTCSSL